MRTAASSFVLLCSALAMIACGGKDGSIRYLVDNDIPLEIRSEIHALNGRLLKAFQDDDPSVMTELFAEEVKRKRDFQRFDEIFASLRDWHQDTQVSLYHEFYAEFTDADPEVKWPLTLNEEADFFLETTASAPSVYFSLLLAKVGFQDLLIGIKYVKPGDDWELYEYRINQYRIAGQSAVGWYHEAKKFHENNLLVPALVRMTIARGLLKPLPFFRFVLEEEIANYLVELEREMDSTYHLPIVLSDLPSEPSVIKVEPLFLGSTLTLKVHYVSSLEFEEDTLQAEAASMVPELAKIFPGFCDGIEQVAFTVYSEPPVSEEKQYLTYGVVAACKPAEGS